MNNKIVIGVVLIIGFLLLTSLGIGIGAFFFLQPKPSSIQVLILTNEHEKQEAETMRMHINSLTKTTGTMVHANIRHIKPGVLTSQDYRLVILYGDNTALTHEARTEITKYVEQGGSLLIIKGAGLHQLKEDKVTVSPWVFGWAVGDMERIIKFKPDCTLTGCKSVGDVTVTPNEMNPPVSLVPIQYDHSIIKRTGISAPLDVELKEGFNGVITVKEQEQSIAEINWFDSERNERRVPAIISYNTGQTSQKGKVTYLAYNPMQLQQETLFRNIIEHAMRK